MCGKKSISNQIQQSNELFLSPNIYKQILCTQRDWVERWNAITAYWKKKQHNFTRASVSWQTAFCNACAEVRMCCAVVPPTFPLSALQKQKQRPKPVYFVTWNVAEICLLSFVISTQRSTKKSILLIIYLGARTSTIEAKKNETYFSCPSASIVYTCPWKRIIRQHSFSSSLRPTNVLCIRFWFSDVSSSQIVGQTDSHFIDYSHDPIREPTRQEIHSICFSLMAYAIVYVCECERACRTDVIRLLWGLVSILISAIQHLKSLGSCEKKHCYCAVGHMCTFSCIHSLFACVCVWRDTHDDVITHTNRVQI